MHEKRVSQRSPIELAASYGVPDDPRLNYAVKVKNISAGGFAITSQEKLKAGKEIKLSIDLEDGHPAEINARVVWCTKNLDSSDFHVGVQIVEGQGIDFKRFLEFYIKTIQS